VGATGLATNPTEYRRRLAEQSDDQLDAWVEEYLRDAARRRGVVAVVAEFRKAARLDEPGMLRIFARGGGSPATAGHDAEGHLIVPTIQLHFLVTGLRADVPEARARLIDYLVAGFGEIAYI
jgi:hypothetical protein